MLLGLRPRSSTALVTFFAALVALLAPAASAVAAPTALSPRLSELATPAVAAEAPAGQAAALGLPHSGAGSLVRLGDTVVVEAHFEAGAVAGIEAVKAAGARVIDASRRYQTLVLAVEPADLSRLAAVPGVIAVTPSLAPEVAAVGAGTAATPSNGLCEGGSVITQGLGQLNVAAARGAFGTHGAGETIGVISDSFDSATLQGGQPIPTHAHEDEVTNDLPGRASTCSGQQVPVNVIAEDPPGQPAVEYTDEGRAMLGVVHDLAPHAKLAFATGNPSEISYAQNIERLAAPVSAGGAGADVIVDDLTYQSEPFFQDGPVADAIRRVSEKGVLYFSAAGNENLFNSAGEEISSWEAPHYRSAPTCNARVVALITAGLATEGKGPYEPDCMDFDPGAAVDTEFGITVDPGRPLSLDLQWAEPWYGVESAFLAFLVTGSGAGEQIVAEGGDNELGLQPFLPLFWQNPTSSPQAVRLVIARCAGVACNPAASSTIDPRIKFEILEDGFGVSETEYPKGKVEGTEDIVGPTIYGHAGSADDIALAAVNFAEPSTAPKAPEPYSSRGPVTHYFGPVTSTTPAAELSSPEVLAKPDITATDCASTTFFGQFENGGWHFCGTSEAAEHAATIAALMQQSDPFATPAQIVSKLESTATPFTTVNSADAVGAGMVNALAAMTALGGAAVDDPPSHVVPSLEEEAAAPAPVVTITRGPKSLGKENRPTFEFSSTRPVAFTCQIDGGAPQPCASPYIVPTKLADGAHGFAVTGTDAQGRSGSSGVYSFTIDTKAPRTTIVRHPKKVVKTKKRSVVAHFKVKANEAPVTFYCQVDKEPLRICAKTFHRRFTPGSHVLKVRAMDQTGNLATSWASYRFRVKQVGRRSQPSAG
jgi:Subtilase family